MNKPKSLQQINALGYRPIDFYLSKSCNKSCHYCTAWTLEMRNLTVDMDFLKSVLDMFKNYKMRVDLLGGEPGLIKNLKEVIQEIKKYPNIVPAVLSNSLVRKKYPWILEDPEIYYIEHLVLDFHEDQIEKLGNYDFFEINDYNNYNLVIKTPGYYDYVANHKLEIYHENTILKEYNSRSPTFNVINFVKQAPELDRKICAAFPSTPVIDFEFRKIRHCSKKVIDGSRQFDITQDNVDKMMSYDLFKYEEYCKTCMDVISPRAWHTQEEILNILEKI